MPFSDDYTDSEEESSDEESIESDPHTSDEEFIDDSSVSSVSGSESDVEITEEEIIVNDEDRDLIFENILTGTVCIPDDNPKQLSGMQQEHKQTDQPDESHSGGDEKFCTPPISTSSENEVLEKPNVLPEGHVATERMTTMQSDQKEIQQSPRKKRKSTHSFRADVGFKEALMKLINRE